jgi:hypothetical protein
MRPEATSVYIYIYIYTHTYIHTYIHTYKYVCMYVCIYVCMYVCMHACMYVCLYVCIYGCMYIRMYACIHVCICIYIHAGVAGVGGVASFSEFRNSEFKLGLPGPQFTRFTSTKVQILTARSCVPRCPGACRLFVYNREPLGRCERADGCAHAHLLSRLALRHS